jgi:AMIN domain
MIQAQAARRTAGQMGATPAPVPAQPAAPQPNATPPNQVPTNAVPPSQTQQGQAPQSQVQPSQPAAQPAVPPGTSTYALPPAAVKSVKVVHDKTGSVIEITTSRPVPPALQTLPNPPRLVIDLPNANVAVKEKHIAAKGGEFTDVRVDQFQVMPPVTRVVVDLVEPRQYTWDGAGNRLTIRVKPPEDPAAKAAPPMQPATIPTFGSAAQPAVVPVSSRPAGSAVIAGSRIGNGSSVTASVETAVLHIARGGELHVCPGSTVSVTASKNGQELMFGMSSGALETHYHLDAASDAVLTPDFRILLSGPGDFDYAISSNSHGDTCIRALLGNTASLMVSELMGDRTYQVKPTEQLVFHEGRIDRVSNDVPFDCGCAAPPPPVMRASATAAPPTVSEANLPPNVHLPSSAAPARASLDPMLPPMPSPSRPAVSGPPGSQVNMASARPETAPVPQSKPADIHVQIEAPLVFRGSDRPKAATQSATNMPPKPATAAPRSDPTAPIPPPVPPPKAPDEAQAKQHRGFFGRVKGFFSAVFK